MAPPRVAALLALVAVFPLAGCGDDAPAADGRLEVVAAFYPLQWIAEQVGGPHVRVRGLTPPGAEPHDLELSPAQVGEVADAELAVVLSGFQPAVDEAAEGRDGPTFDAADHARLDLTFTPIEDGEAHADEAGATDPHFWLDPLRLADVADALAAELRGIDAAHAADYTAGAAQLRDRLTALDAELTQGLADCRDDRLVTSHNAFGYLAERYGFRQVGITGLTPEEEPSPADLAAVTELIRAEDVGTVYFETLVSPAIARTVADETGATTAVLDPIEGIGDASAGDNYLAVMRSNLATLQRGQRCS